MSALNEKTLVLNQGYQPTAIVPWQKAITLLFLEKAEVVREYEDRDIRSTRLVIKMPAVVRLVKAFKGRSKPVKFNRINIFARDDYSCLYCGKKYPVKQLTFDHVNPKSRGGKTKWDNIATACGKCNRKKGGRLPDEAGMKLKTKPYRPKKTPSLVVTISQTSVPDAWRDFLYWTGELTE